MRPILFELPLPGGRGLPIHGHGLSILIGFLLAVWVCSREAKRRGLPPLAYDLGLVTLISGLVGGRAFYYFEFYEEYYAGLSFFEFFKIWSGGLVFYGGAIGGILGAFSFLVLRRLPVASSFDVVAVGAPIGMAFGRLGCFLKGCCFGKLCDPEHPLGVVFPAASSASKMQRQLGLIDGVDTPALPVHPVQLYQAANDMMLFVLIYIYLTRRGTPVGAGFPALLILYGLGRFCLEGLRADNRETSTGLTVSQNISLVAVALGLILLGFLYKRTGVGAQHRKKSEKRAQIS